MTGFVLVDPGYSKYIEYNTIYGTCGIKSLLAHLYDFTMKLSWRCALDNLLVVGVDGIRLDFGR